MTLVIARVDGPDVGVHGEPVWSGRSTPNTPVELVLAEADHAQMLSELNERGRFERCVKCGARCALFVKRWDGGPWELSIPVDDLYCDRCVTA